jgi:hypothetical protein
MHMIIHRVPFQQFNPFLLAQFPQNLPNRSPKITFLRYFGMKTT